MKLTSNALLTISIILLSSLTACSQNTKPSTSTKWDASPVIQEMNKQAFIDHPQQWKEITQKYNYGKKIHSLKTLNQVLYTGNKHASAVNSMHDFENINYPKLTIQDNLKIINIPSFYSLKSKVRNKYVAILKSKIKQIPKKHTYLKLFKQSRWRLQSDDCWFGKFYS